MLRAGGLCWGVQQVLQLRVPPRAVGATGLATPRDGGPAAGRAAQRRSCSAVRWRSYERSCSGVLQWRAQRRAVESYKGACRAAQPWPCKGGRSAAQLRLRCFAMDSQRGRRGVRSGVWNGIAAAVSNILQ